MPPASVEVNANVADVVLTAAAGPAVMLVSGGVPSVVHVLDAGVASVWPSASFARASNVCDPSASDDNVAGDVQKYHGPPSSRHSSVAPVCEALNSTISDRFIVTPTGPRLIVVSGALSAGGVGVPGPGAGPPPAGEVGSDAPGAGAAIGFVVVVTGASATGTFSVPAERQLFVPFDSRTFERTSRQTDTA